MSPTTAPINTTVTDISSPTTTPALDSDYPAPHPTRAFRQWFPYSRTLVRVLARVLAPMHSETGRGHVPHKGGVIIAPNHVADIDPPFVAAGCTRPLWFMAKRELFKIPILGAGMRFYQSFPVDPGSPDREALRFAEELLKNGQAVVIFPEGRISHTGELGAFLPGAAMIALRSGVPVVPCGIAGTNHIIPYGSVVPRPTLKPVRVVFGKPLLFDDLAKMPKKKAREEAADRLETAIRACARAAKL